MIINNEHKQGFTLIELLIVIALLGALAVGLLAALDPFEQLKKGTDTGIRNTVSEFHGAVIRFYALKNQMPWCDPGDGNDCGDPTSAANTIPTTIDSVQLEEMTDPTNTVAAADVNNWLALDQVVDSGELKAEFATLAGNQLSKIYVTGVSDSVGTPKIIVCYKPTSKSFQQDKNTKFYANGDIVPTTGIASTVCKSQSTTGTRECFWCIQ